MTAGMEAMMNRQSEKITALYCRLGHMHGDMDDFAARNQMEILSEYAKKHGLENPEFFCDWGFNGSSAKWPQYQRMLQRIRDGKVSALVVRNLNRLGRDYSATTDQFENILSQYGVVFHSVQDGIGIPEVMKQLHDYRAILDAFRSHQRSRKGGCR